MFINSYSRGFPNTHAFGRGHSIQFYKPISQNKSNLNTTYSQTLFFAENGSSESIHVCQIYHKFGHITDACWHRYGESYVPQPKYFSRGRGPRSSYMASFEPHIGLLHHMKNHILWITLTIKCQI